MLNPINMTAGGSFALGATETRILAKASLLAAAGAATAIVRETDAAGRILAVLGAAAGLSSQWEGPVPYRGTLFVTLTGTPTTFLVYEG